jgi:ABC-type branched-subunit amino acid transport system substrate-binding protein
MASKYYRIGVLLSSSGPYEIVARSMRNGAMLAFEELNAEGALGIALEPCLFDPGGDLRLYSDMAAEALASGIRHVIGCYTSSSRKEVIPYFEKHDALLWYPSHYEGFESSGNVIYTGAAPNQHILPLVEHLAPTSGTRAFCVGSNYIWAWENNRILREALSARGGAVVAERFLPIGETDLAQVIEAILKARPDFVFSTLIGTSAYQFFRDFRQACQARDIDQPREIPVASCSLSEPELEAIGMQAVDGHLSSSVYFSTIETPENAAFVERYSAAFPAGPTMSADAEASYIAVRLLGQSLAAAGTDNVAGVRAAVLDQQLDAPQGKVRIDAQTFHAYLTPRIGRSNRNGRFDVLLESGEPVRPDPYLVQTAPRFALQEYGPRLRLVQ